MFVLRKRMSAATGDGDRWMNQLTRFASMEAFDLLHLNYNKL